MCGQSLLSGYTVLAGGIEIAGMFSCNNLSGNVMNVTDFCRYVENVKSDSGFLWKIGELQFGAGKSFTCAEFVAELRVHDIRISIAERRHRAL